MSKSQIVIQCKLAMESYIAHPYWPEKERVIGIELRSGVNRLKLDEKKAAALKSQCEKEGITLADYHRFVEQAKRQWYRVDNDDLKSLIVIPRHQLAGALVETISRTPKAVHGPYCAESFRHHVQLSDFVTDRTNCDGVFDRYVKLEGSNKRDHQVNEKITSFEAVGTMTVGSDTKLADLRRLLAYAVNNVGVGACRKMGFGFGEVVEFK